MFLKPNSKIIIDILQHILLGQKGHRTDVKQAFSQECVPKKKKFYFSTKTYVVDTQKNCLNETVLLSTQNICYNLWVRKHLQFYA